MRYRHTNRPGFLLRLIDFFTAGLYFCCICRWEACRKNWMRFWGGKPSAIGRHGK